MSNFSFANEESLLLLTAKLSHLLRKDMERLLRQHDFPVGIDLYLTLSLLKEKTGKSQQEIARALGKDNPRMTRIIDKMERRNLVIRTPHPTDRRANLIYLSKEGILWRDRGQELFDTYLHNQLHWASTGELSIFYRMLNRTINEVEKPK